MSREDEYRIAAGIAREKLAALGGEEICTRLGMDAPESEKGKNPSVKYMGREIQLSLEDFSVIPPEGAHFTIYDEIIVLHYLLATPIAEVTGEDISFRDVPGASFYFGPFSKRTSIPLAGRFGEDLASFDRVAGYLQATKEEYADACYSFPVLPGVDVKISIWQADEDFDASANLTFDRNIISIFDAEGVAAIGTALSFGLIGMARA